MKYAESYKGRRIIVTTREERAGAWTAHAEWLDAAQQRSVVGDENPYRSEEDARRAAVSAAAAAIDRARASHGKP
jgi:hypothetical protein